MRKVAGALMKIFADKNAPKYYPEFFAEIEKKYKGDFNKYAAKMYQKSIFDNKEELTAFLDNPTQKTLEKDMAFNAAVEVFKKYREIGETLREGNEKLLKGRRLFVAGLMEMEKDKTFYPDANSTMRLTYGKVLDYDPRDGVTYKYYTTTDGYLEKRNTR